MAAAFALRAVSPASGVPLHRQAETQLRQLAANPALRPGALLPDELTIANRLGVSRGTARAAIMRLVNDRVIERKRGVGTRLAQRPAESGVRAWRSFTREMASQGVTVQTFRSAFGRARATRAPALALGVKAGARVPRLDRLRGWDGVPVLLCRSWLHPRLGLTKQLDLTRPLYDVIEECSGVVADRAHEEFGAVCADAALAAQLHVPEGAPLLCRRHNVCDTRGRPIEYAELYYVTARFKLTMELKREAP